MSGYLIKGTYLTGIHKGETYLLRKGGYVTDESQYQWGDTMYKSIGQALRICRKLKEENELDYAIERRNNEWAIAKGGKPKEFFIYELESYEPYMVTDDKIVD